MTAPKKWPFISALMATPALEADRGYRLWRWTVFTRFLTVIVLASGFGFTVNHSGLVNGPLTSMACLVLSILDMVVIRPLMLFNRYMRVIPASDPMRCADAFPTILSHLLYRMQYMMQDWNSFISFNPQTFLETPALDAHQYGLAQCRGDLEQCDQQMLAFNLIAFTPWLGLLLGLVTIVVAKCVVDGAQF